MEAVSCVNMRVFGVLLFCLIDVRGSETQGIDLNQNTTQTPEEKLGRNSIIPQADGFSSENISSGPIVFLDKYHLFIANFKYEPQDDTTHFCVNGSFSSQIVTVPYNETSTNILSGHYGSAVNLWFPENVTTDDVEHFGICDDQKFLVSVNLNDVIAKNDVNEPEIQRTDKNVFRIPTCCPQNQQFNDDFKCQETPSTKDITNITVIQSNKTHLNTKETIESTLFIPYHYRVRCHASETSLVWGNLSNIYGLIFNTSLLAHKVSHLISPGSYCFEQKGDETLVVICYSIPTIATTASFTANLYLILLVASTICFAVAAICYWYILPAKSKSLNETHKKYFTGYSSSMCLTFLMLILLHLIGNENACNVLGSFFLLSNTMSFAFLAVLCVDLLTIVHNFDNHKTHLKLKFFGYVGASIGLALLILVISLIIPPSGVPDVPAGFIKNSGSSCNFRDSNLFVFYIPVGILIVISGIALGATKYVICQNENDAGINYFWIEGRTNFKFMWSQSFMTLLVMTLSACLELVLNLIEPSIGYFFTVSIVESLQGVFVIMIFISNNYHKNVRDNKDSKRNNIVLEPLNGHQETV